MTAQTYEEFLAAKTPQIERMGREPGRLHKSLYPFQRAVTEWAIRRGRSAIFEDCGLGKTRQQIEWARQFAGRVLIVAPLAVAEQTIAEADLIGVDVRSADEPDGDGIYITNYERLHRWVGVPLDGIVLDESSILKSIDGKTRTMLLRDFTSIPHRLCCTATPAPNDVSELANHAEFLGVMSRAEMLATYFVNDTSHGDGWRLKRHAANAMWRWMAQWAVFLRRPSDLGYGDDGYDLPPLSVCDVVVPSDWRPEGQLFATGIGGVGGRAKVRRHTIAARVAAAAEICRAAPGDQVLVWCGLNDEGRALADALGGECALIEGSDRDEDKIERERAWREGHVRVLVTKPSMFGFGMNWQHCHRQVFLGLGDSYEQYYQAIRRSWRFGQRHPVEVSIIVSDVEGGIAANVKRKEADAKAMAEGVIAAMREEQIQEVRNGAAAATSATYERNDDVYLDRWHLMLGDCVERIRDVPNESVGLSIFSPPFASLYTYSASERDMGNCRDYEQFFGHFSFVIPEILRVTMPGRRCAVHVQQVATLKGVDGVIGWRDFRADVVKAFVAGGWVYDGEIVVDKDPQAQAIRTKSKQLMFVQKERDASWLRPAMADYIVLFRHPGANPTVVTSDVTNDEWILWARPIWYGIRESDTLQYTSARDDEDEKHICPLQLETIERCIRLWTNKGETVADWFAGIGSTGYVAQRTGRKFVGTELKVSYWRQACKNLRAAIAQLGLFDRLDHG